MRFSPDERALRSNRVVFIVLSSSRIGMADSTRRRLGRREELGRASASKDRMAEIDAIAIIEGIAKRNTRFLLLRLQTVTNRV
jgi:hypothetical protein